MTSFKLAWIVLGFIFASLFGALGQAAANAAERHYFRNADAQGCSLVQNNESRDDARKACGGMEYPGFETVRDGFAFSLNEKASLFYTFPNWAPPTDKDLDFFVGDKNLFLVYYKDGRVTMTASYPLEAPSPSNPVKLF